MDTPDATGGALLLQLVGDLAALHAAVTALARAAPPETRAGVRAALAALAGDDAGGDVPMSAEAGLVHRAVQQRAALLLAAVEGGRPPRT